MKNKLLLACSVLLLSILVGVGLHTPVAHSAEKSCAVQGVQIDDIDADVRIKAPQTASPNQSFTASGIKIIIAKDVFLGQEVNSITLNLSASKTTAGSYSKQEASKTTAGEEGSEIVTYSFPNWSLTANGSGNDIRIDIDDIVAEVEGFGDYTCVFGEKLATINVSAPSGSGGGNAQTQQTTSTTTDAPDETDEEEEEKKEEEAKEDKSVQQNETIIGEDSERTNLRFAIKNSQGEPLIGAKLQLDTGATTTTDEAGKASMEGIVPGLHEVSVSYQNYMVTERIRVNYTEEGNSFVISVPVEHSQTYGIAGAVMGFMTVASTSVYFLKPF
ncbi:MAG: carboxypeptidase-like regulatory domain-containing protein [Candidatus Saccharibacteria bacterium]|nr:carboxypeptidase-like regulatory domain-containing protein [Candidatus Saccharibacteria bacterium]